jgi:hypothetical protein
MGVVFLSVLPTPESGIVDPEDTVVAQQRFGTYVSAAKNTTVTIEKLI